MFCAKVIVRGRAVRRFAATRTEAQRRLRELQAEKIGGQVVIGRSPTVAEYLRTWIDDRDPLLPNAGVEKLAYHTIGGYRRRAAHLITTIGAVQIRKLEPADVRRGLAAVSATGVSDTTVSDCRVFLATVLKSAMRERPAKVTFNAAELVDHIKRTEHEQYALDEEEAGRFLAAAKGQRLYSALLVAVHVGPRAGELWGARWRAIDWQKGTLHISESLYWITADTGREREFATKGPKTAHGDRIIRLSKAALEALRAHRAAEAQRLGTVPHRDAFIWTDEQGGPIDHRNMLRDVFYPVCKAAGIPYVGAHTCVDPSTHRGCPAVLTFHGLRHSAATLALAATKDVIAVSRMLGHASTEFTMDVYGHVLVKQQQEIADYMDAAVHG